MTLVAAYKRYGIPLLMSDVLISTEGSAGQHFDLATLADLDEALPPDKGITVLPPAQKTYIISNTLCVAWCGSFGSASIAVSRITGAFGSAQPTDKELGDFLTSTLRPELEANWRIYGIGPDKGGLELVGWLIDRSVPKAFRWDTFDWSLDTSSAREVCGTGATTFTRFFLDPPFAANYRPSPNADPAEPAILDALYDVAQLLTLERRNVRLRFGGGFQITYFSNGGFHHVDNYIVLTSRGTVHEGRTSHIEFSSPYVTFNHVGPFLVIRNFGLGPMQMVNDFEGSAEITKVVPNVARRAGAATPNPNTFMNMGVQPKYCLFPFIWRWPDDHASISGNVFPCSEAPAGNIRIRRDGDRMHVRMGPNFEQIVRRSADQGHALHLASDEKIELDYME